MNKKDIALTVGGIVATFALAYLLYQLQQKNAAASAANSSDSQEQALENQQEFDSLLTPSLSGGTAQPISTPTINTNANLDTTGDPSTDSGSSDENLISSLLSDFTSVLNGPGVTSGNAAASSLIIPTIDEQQGLGGNTSNVPVTASAATNGALSMLPGNNVATSSPSNAVQPVTVSSRNGLNTNVSPLQLVS